MRSPERTGAPSGQPAAGTCETDAMFKAATPSPADGCSPTRIASTSTERPAATSPFGFGIHNCLGAHLAWLGAGGAGRGVQAVPGVGRGLEQRPEGAHLDRARLRQIPRDRSRPARDVGLRLVPIIVTAGRRFCCAKATARTARSRPAPWPT